MRYAEIQYSHEARRRIIERDIDEDAIAIAVERGEIIEDAHRPGRRLPTRVYLDYVNDRPIHVVVAYEDDTATATVVTVYEPTLDRWTPGYTERRRT